METPSRIQRSVHFKNLQHLSTPLKIPASPFMKSIGYGTGVKVYRLERSPKSGEMRSPWAVKKVTQKVQTDLREIFSERIQEEAEILRKLSHPNIVGFRGVVKAQDGSVDSLALECCKTSLGAILEERYEDKLGPLPATHTLRMIRDIGRALDYLHTEAHLLHGDLKSFNVLVKEEFEICKLCDFGVSLSMDENGLIDFSKNPKIRYVGTNLWSAPEVIYEADVIDSKADIFSFGLVIYETIALVPPHTFDTRDDCEEIVEEMENSICSTTTSNESQDESLIDCVYPACGTRPLLPRVFELSPDYNRILELFYICTNEYAEDRPTAKTIWESLEVEPL